MNKTLGLRPVAVWYRVAAAALLSLTFLSAHAQVRSFPVGAKTGTLKMGVFPEASIDGTSVRFGAGARIMNRENRIVLPANVTAAVPVAYVVDFQGLVKQAWIVSDEETRALKKAAK